MVPHGVERHELEDYHGVVKFDSVDQCDVGTVEEEDRHDVKLPEGNRLDVVDLEMDRYGEGVFVDPHAALPERQCGEVELGAEGHPSYDLLAGHDLDEEDQLYGEAFLEVGG